LLVSLGALATAGCGKEAESPRTTPERMVAPAKGSPSSAPPNTPNLKAEPTPVLTPAVADAAQAVATLRKFGAVVRVNDADPDKPVVDVRLNGPDANDDMLALVRGFGKLHTLDLHGSSVTNEGLANVHLLTQLRSLNLSGSKIGTQGLEYLRDLGE